MANEYEILNSTEYNLRAQISHWLKYNRELIDDVIDYLGAVPPAGIALKYDWQTSTASADPGTGYIAGNQPTHNLVNELYISKTSSSGNNLSVYWEALQPGDIVYIFQIPAPSNSSYYEVSLAVQDQGDWYILQVDPMAAAGQALPTTLDDDCEIGLIANPNRYLPAGGFPNDILVKQSLDNYDVAWEDGTTLYLPADTQHNDLPGIGPDDHHNKEHNHNADGSGVVSHDSLANILPDDHHDKLHTHDGDGSGPISHLALTDVGENDHHPKSHAHDGVDGSGTVDHSVLLNIGDDDHHPKFHAHDGTDGSGVVGHDDLIGITPDNHHDKVHSHDGLDGSGSVAHDSLTGITPNDHHNQVHLLYGPDQSDVSTATVLETRMGLFWSGSLFQAETRMNWRNVWGQQTYEKHDVVIDGSWLMISNKVTDERAAPQPVGDSAFVYSGTPLSGAQLGKQLIVGARYAPQLDTQLVSGWRIDVVAGNNYTIYSVKDPLGPSPIINQLIAFNASITGWSEYTVEPIFVGVGEVFDLVAVIQEPNPTPVEFNGNWNYITPTNDAIPAVGQIIHSNKSVESFRVNKTDSDAGDRSAELEGLEIGDVIKGAGREWSIQTVVDNGTWMDYAVAPASQGSPDGVQNFIFETVTDTPISYIYDTDYWLAQPAVQGLFGLDIPYDTIVPDNNQYNIDIQLQPYYVSPDWDLMSTSASGSGGGGEGGAFPEPPDDGVTYGRQYEVWNAVFTKTEANGLFLSVPDVIAGQQITVTDNLDGTLTIATDPLLAPEAPAVDALHGRNAVLDVWEEVYSKQDARYDLLGEAWGTSLFDGGELNIVGVALTDIEVIAGAGPIMDSYTDPLEVPIRVNLSWPTLQETITALPAVAGSVVYFSIADSGTTVGAPEPNSNLGVLVQRGTAPTPAQVRDEVQLGYSVHNGSAWKDVSSPLVVNNTVHTVGEYLNDIAGRSFIESGGRVTMEIGFTLDMATYVIWELNRNWHNNRKDPHRESYPALSPIQWRYINRDFTEVSALTSVVDPTQYDPAGTVVPVGGGANTATIQRLYLDPADNYWVLWGQNVHDTYWEAVNSIGSDTTDTVFPEQGINAIFLGYIISEKSETEWVEEEAQFLTAVESTGGSGSTPSANTFLELTDTPTDYTGEALRSVKVNTLEDGLVYGELYQTDPDPGDSNAVFTGLASPSPSYHLDIGPFGQYEGIKTIWIPNVFPGENSGGRILFQVEGGSWELNGKRGTASNNPFFQINYGPTERLRIDSTGNMSLGGFLPTYKLDVDGDINTSGVYRVNGVPLDLTNYWTASGDDIYSNNIGNVGIGTTTPQRKLHVTGETIFGDGLLEYVTSFDQAVFTGATVSGVLIQATAGNTTQLTLAEGTDRNFIISATTGGNVTFWTRNNLNSMTFSPDGFVGINTSNTDYPLVVGGDVNITGQYLVNGVPISSGSGFWTDNGADIYNINAGNVGIGTTLPAEKLDVAGNIRLSSGRVITAEGDLTVQQTGDQFGTSQLILKNRSGANGAEFKCPDIDLVDFLFTPQTAPTRNIRYEGRAGSTMLGTAGEFGIGDPGSPTLAVSTRAVGSRFYGDLNITGNLGVAITPTRPLHVNGETLMGTAGIIYSTAHDQHAFTSTGAIGVLIQAAAGQDSWLQMTQGATKQMHIRCQGSDVSLGSQLNDTVINYNAAGNVGILTTTLTYEFNVAGSINITGDYLVNGVPIGGGDVNPIWELLGFASVDTWDGLTVKIIAGTTLTTVGGIVAVQNFSTGGLRAYWANSSSRYPVLGVLVVGGNTGQEVEVLVDGWYKSSYTLTDGEYIYASASNGIPTTTVPTTSGHFAKVIGFNGFNGKMLVKPQMNTVEIA